MNGATRFPLSLPAGPRTDSQGNGLGCAAGKEDPVELDSSEPAGAARRRSKVGCCEPLATRPRPPQRWWGVWLGRHARDMQRTRPTAGSAGKETTHGAQGQMPASRAACAARTGNGGLAIPRGTGAGVTEKLPQG